MPNLRRRLAVLCGLALTMHLIGAAQATEPDSNVAGAQGTKCKLQGLRARRLLQGAHRIPAAR
jgi:hypothetical protein